MTGPGPLDIVAAAFGRVLRRQGVAASPAEVIEVRRVLAMLGAADLDALRSGLRSATAKYDHERAGFERAFDAFFGLVADARTGAASGGPGLLEPGAEGLPTELELAEDDDPLGRYADDDPRAAEVGDVVDAPEKEKGFNPHRDDDLSIAGADSELSVSSGEDQGRRGISYTVDLERAGSAVAKELTSGRSAPVAGSVNWDDPAAILAWLAAYEPHAIYPDGEGERPSAMQLNRLVEAISDFVAALTDRAGAPDPGTGAEPESTFDPADMQRACHELLSRMRGAPRRVPREHSRGPLDVRHTVRHSMRTDGIPFHLVVRRSVPDKIRLLVVADVSLSVRSITAFALRLAQTVHGMAFRCHVLAYVDTPVDVTQILLRVRGDRALAAVLAAPGLDLDATSDYGRVMSALNCEHAGYVDKRTAVLFVGDGRCNGLPTGAEDLRRLRRRAHRIGWITPEPRRYWTQASCAMPAYAEVVDHVVIARDAVELARKAAELGHALS